jgi:hypothetical protein
MRRSLPIQHRAVACQGRGQTPRQPAGQQHCSAEHQERLLQPVGAGQLGAAAFHAEAQAFLQYHQAAAAEVFGAGLQQTGTPGSYSGSLTSKPEFAFWAVQQL